MSTVSADTVGFQSMQRDNVMPSEQFNGPTEYPNTYQRDLQGNWTKVGSCFVYDSRSWQQNSPTFDSTQ